MKTTTQNKLFFINWETLDRLAFQFVPFEVSENRSAFLAEHKVVGRNHPVLQFLGGKTTTSFTVNFYGEKVTEQAIFFKQFSMKEGILVPPPLLKIIWPGLIPDNSLWVVQSAVFNASLFQPSNSFAPRMGTVDLSLIKWTEDNFNFNDVKI